MGYRGEDVPRERMAEAIRQYMTAPDTMKQRFPKTAAAIRTAVNANPRLMDLIQFNSLAGLGLAGASYGMTPGAAEADEIQNYLGGL